MSTITIESAIPQFLRQLQATMQKTTEEVGQELLAESKPEVPIDTSAMINSGKVIMTKGALETIATVEYRTPYVVYQHEDYTLNHPNGGNAGFLIQPFRRIENRLIRRFLEAINRII